MGAEMVVFLESVLSGLDCLDCLAEKGNKVTDVGGGERGWCSAFGEALECSRGRGTPRKLAGGDRGGAL